MRFLLQEQIDNGLQLRVQVCPVTGKVKAADLAALPTVAVGNACIAQPYNWPGWVEEFTKALASLEQGNHLEILLRDRRIYPARARRWVWPSEGPFAQAVYPLPSARMFRLVALSDRYHHERERERASAQPNA